MDIQDYESSSLLETCSLSFQKIMTFLIDSLIDNLDCGNIFPK